MVTGALGGDHRFGRRAALARKRKKVLKIRDLPSLDGAPISKDF
jgi:hypothetical protein